MNSPLSISELPPGSIIQLDDVTQLSAFEDLVAIEIDPTMTEFRRDQWAGRVAVRDLLRPSKFNGTMADIQLVVMNEPYERLFSAIERGWHFSDKGGKPTARSSNEEFINSFLGFSFSANAKSSGRGVIGQIQTEMWYGAIPIRFSTHHYQTKAGERKSYIARTKTSNSHAGTSVQRYVTKPKIETEAFIELDEMARRIGFAVLQQNMRHPIVQPIRN